MCQSLEWLDHLSKHVWTQFIVWVHSSMFVTINNSTLNLLKGFDKLVALTLGSRIMLHQTPSNLVELFQG
jgi:hypothetical protein